MEIIYIFLIIVLCIKLLYERKKYNIGMMTIIIFSMYILIMSVLILVFKFVNLEKIYNALLYIGSIIIALVNSMYSFLSILSSVKYKNKRRDMWYEVINIAVSIVSLILIINI